LNLRTSRNKLVQLAKNAIFLSKLRFPFPGDEGLVFSELPVNHVLYLQQLDSRSTEFQVRQMRNKIGESYEDLAVPDKPDDVTMTRFYWEILREWTNMSSGSEISVPAGKIYKTYSDYLCAC